MTSSAPTTAICPAGDFRLWTAHRTAPRDRRNMNLFKWDTPTARTYRTPSSRFENGDCGHLRERVLRQSGAGQKLDEEIAIHQVVGAGADDVVKFPIHGGHRSCRHVNTTRFRYQNTARTTHLKNRRKQSTIATFDEVECRDRLPHVRSVVISALYMLGLGADGGKTGGVYRGRHTPARRAAARFTLVVCVICRHRIVIAVVNTQNI